MANTKVLYYMFGYNPKTGIPIVTLKSKMEDIDLNTEPKVRYWEVAFDEKKHITELLDEVTNKEYQNSIRLLHAFYKDASIKKTKDINKLDPKLLAQLPPDKLRKTPELMEKIERIKHVIATGKVMEGKKPTSNGHGRGKNLLRRMGMIN